MSMNILKSLFLSCTCVTHSDNMNLYRKINIIANLKYLSSNKLLEN